MRRRGVNHCLGSRNDYTFHMCNNVASSKQIVRLHSIDSMPEYTPYWQFSDGEDMWGDMPPWLSEFLEDLPDDERNGIVLDFQRPGLLRWRYDIPAMKQFREQPNNDNEEWTVGTVRDIRRSLVPIPYQKPFP